MSVFRKSRSPNPGHNSESSCRVLKEFPTDGPGDFTFYEKKQVAVEKVGHTPCDSQKFDRLKRRRWRFSQVAMICFTGVLVVVVSLEDHCDPETRECICFPLFWSFPLVYTSFQASAIWLFSANIVPTWCSNCGNRNQNLVKLWTWNESVERIV